MLDRLTTTDIRELAINDLPAHPDIRARLADLRAEYFDEALGLWLWKPGDDWIHARTQLLAAYAESLHEPKAALELLGRARATKLYNPRKDAWHDAIDTKGKLRSLVHPFDAQLLDVLVTNRLDPEAGRDRYALARKNIRCVRATKYLGNPKVLQYGAEARIPESFSHLLAVIVMARHSPQEAAELFVSIDDSFRTEEGWMKYLPNNITWTRNDRRTIADQLLGAWARSLFDPRGGAADLDRLRKHRREGAAAWCEIEEDAAACADAQLIGLIVEDLVALYGQSADSDIPPPVSLTFDTNA